VVKSPSEHTQRFTEEEAIAAGSGCKRLAPWSQPESLARQFTPEATRILIDIVRDPCEEARNRIVAIGMLYDRAWDKPRDYNPETDQEVVPPRFDPSLFTREQLVQIEQTSRMIAATQTKA
jgi:hypothetical protein